MQISSATSSPFQTRSGGDPFAKVKQSFDNIGKALDAGNLSDAKDALAQLQKNAPPQAGNGKNPLSDKVDALSKALDSGDVKDAQAAFVAIKQAVAQRPNFGAGRPQGPPPGGAPPQGAGKPESAGASSDSNKVYDKMDANKDGQVSFQEEQDYKQKHPDATTKSAGTSTSNVVKIDSDRGILDATA